MKYKNAGELLPDELLRELQKYAGGEVVYVPSAGTRKQWGQASGAKQYYSRRNEEIRQKYRVSRNLQQLAEEYHLSVDTIRKIVFK